MRRALEAKVAVEEEVVKAQSAQVRPVSHRLGSLVPSLGRGLFCRASALRAGRDGAWQRAEVAEWVTGGCSGTGRMREAKLTAFMYCHRLGGPPQADI